jgi:hypothetical protein
MYKIIKINLRMKAFILALLLITISVSGNAQSNKSMIYGDAVAKYKKMEITGTVLTIVGGVTLFTGNFLYWKSYNGQNEGDTQENKVNNSRKLMLAGIGIMAVGIPLWAVAKSKERRITIEAQLVRFKGLVYANGVGLKIKF